MLSTKIVPFSGPPQGLGDRYRFLARQEAFSPRKDYVVYFLQFTAHRARILLGAAAATLLPYANQNFLYAQETRRKLMNTLLHKSDDGNFPSCTLTAAAPPEGNNPISEGRSHYKPQKHQHS